MARALLIAEKPSLMREIQSAYHTFGHKDTIEFKSFAGHTMGLISPDKYKKEWEKWDLATLPLVPDKFIYEPTKDKLDMYKDIKKAIKNGNYDYIINGCDPGREGQHIFFSFYDSIGCNLPVKRIWHSDLTEKELKRALDNLRDENEPALSNMTKASKLRAYFDWLIGMNFTRAFSIVGGKKMNLGRVMTPALKVLVDRELEIKNFVPKNFWEIEADFGKYKGVYFNEDGDTQFWKQEDAQKLIDSLSTDSTVKIVNQEKDVKYAPQLHSLSALQNEANSAYGYTMQETLNITQTLYEKKFVSYPRTDSSHLTKAISNDFAIMLRPLQNIPELADKTKAIINDSKILSDIANNKKYVDDKKVSDHYAIVPTGLSPDFGRLTDKEINIYMLIAKRFLSIFLPPMVTQKTSVVTENNGHLFKTSGSVLESIGFMALYNYKAQDNMLPPLKKGEAVSLKKAELITKQTSKPGRYTDRTLNIAMENAGRFIDDDELKEVLKEAKGIGTPATRGGIVEKLVSLNMIERKKKSFFATEYGIGIIQSLNGHDITSPELTAKWEQKLSEIEANQFDPNVFYKEMIDYIQKEVEDLKKLKVFVSSSKDSLGSCPKCGKHVIEGKKYYLCEAYKNGCDFLFGKTFLEAKITKAEIKKILSGKPSKELDFTKNGKTWKAKLAVNKDKGSIDMIFNSDAKKSKSTNSSNASKSVVICKCPKCGGGIKETSKYFLCENYKNPCTVLIGKEYFGAKITKKEAIDLLNGKETGEKTMTWSSGKTSSAKLKYTNKLQTVSTK
ncbi:DNA topoisomerase [Bacillus cereus group sp. BfR-BA-01363]|uniref:type IA DNA topoisomerase n=1 Tax=Bacillus cereus group sp. BfR-BA-01363 TaxID=3094882 RepID=UPI0029C56BC1|nr:DNA topoisomerase [Bacillus cereus group sp. BfR-BA-01363]MDX5853122.1 DNA topoisomerase [Bacillus cereus group sp. BfR-BA-01363]